MSNIETEATAPVMEQSSKKLDFLKVDALRKHMLLTVDSMVTLLSTTRVSYYNWLNGKAMRKGTADRIRPIVRELLSYVSEGTWPNPTVYMANQAERLKMLQELMNKAA